MNCDWIHEASLTELSGPDYAPPMTGHPAPHAGDHDTPLGRDSYQTGPWLVVHGRGTSSAACADQIVGHCEARGVHYDLLTIDEVAGVDLSYYTALIVVLPSDITTDKRAGQSLSKFIEIIKIYRARRPDGLSTLLDGTKRWFHAGVVQLVSAGAVPDGLKSIMNRVCQVYEIRDGEAVDPFTVYQVHEHPAPPTRPTEHLARTLQELRAYLLLWGFNVLEDVTPARELIDQCRRRYENPRYTRLHRPIADRNLNQLDFLLDEPQTRGPGNKKWMENGARVAREVITELLTHCRQNGELAFPNFHKPAGRENKKDAQKDLYKLYMALRAYEDLTKVFDRQRRDS